MPAVLIAIAIGIGIFSVGLWIVRALALPPPPEPDPGTVVNVSLDYRCKVCGLFLTVTRAQDEEPVAPKHCREEMTAI